MNVILCGMPKSGKTTVGKSLAKKLGLNFIDTDRCIESAYEEQSGNVFSCRQIYGHLGETAFRDLEKNQIHLLKGVRTSVIAVGGGALNIPENVAFLRSIGSIVYLSASVYVLWNRIQRQGIPPYLNTPNPEKAFEELLKNRLAFFESAADWSINTDGLSLNKIVDRIIAYYGE